jgi:hypothetical protein
LILQQI